MIKLKLTFESPAFQEPRRLIWEATELSIGRSSRTDFVVPLATLSSHHLTFRRRDGAYEVTDAGSRNGTLLDEVRLEPQHFVPVRHGMVLRTIDLTIRVELTEEYDAESFTMQTATQAIRDMAQDALHHDGQSQDAYLEALNSPLKGRKFLLDDRLQRAFVGSGQGALIRLHEMKLPERALAIERTEVGFLIEPLDDAIRVLVNGEPIAGRYELASRERIVLGELELYFFDPVEDLMLVLDGVLPPVERIEEGKQQAILAGEQGTSTPMAALVPESSVPQQELAPALAPQEEAAQEAAPVKSSRLSPLEIMIMLFILLMVGAAIVVMIVFVTS